MKLRAFTIEDYPEVKRLYTASDIDGARFGDRVESTERLSELVNSETGSVWIGEDDGTMTTAVIIYEDGKTVWLHTLKGQ